jgi:hypothetical protein
MDNPEAVAANDEVVPVWVLFQSRSIPTDSDFIEEYVAANGDPHEYRTTYYHRIVCCAHYSTRLELTFVTVAPNVSVTLTKIADSQKPRRHTKLRSYADFESVCKTRDYIDASFQGVSGIDDPRILALGYCLGLAFPKTPIRAVIQGSVYTVGVDIGPNFYRYEGTAVLRSGSAKAILELQTDSLSVSHLSDVQESQVSKLEGATVASLVARTDAIGHQLVLLQQRIQDQEMLYRDAIDQHSKSTLDMFQQIIKQLTKPQPVQNTIPRLAPPRHVTSTPVQQEKKKLTIEVSNAWEKAASPPSPTPVKTSPKRRIESRRDLTSGSFEEPKKKEAESKKRVTKPNVGETEKKGERGRVTTSRKGIPMDLSVVLNDFSYGEDEFLNMLMNNNPK